MLRDSEIDVEKNRTTLRKRRRDRKMDKEIDGDIDTVTDRDRQTSEKECHK
jgi:hypothetical protein